VTKLAQEYGLSPNMVFRWRRQLKAGLLGGAAHGAAALLPVMLHVAPTEEKAQPGSSTSKSVEPSGECASAPSSIEIELNGARVRVMGMVDPAQLRLVLRCLMTA
jgi:transposase